MSAEGVGVLVATLAVCLNAWSMLYLAKQTKAAARQTQVAMEQAKVSNVVAAVSANDTVLGSLREVHVLMLEREGVREYFYGGKPLPGTGPEREAVLTLAELLADVMSSGVHVHARVPDSGSTGPWGDYCRHTVENSPVLRHLLRAHPTWWPPLMSILPDSLLRADDPARVPAPDSDRADA
ncbi:hypothetical protein [Streptomyces sp. NBC_00687]|uniref:hypothetical protein n=1 Tax=Streptomyces sp. NBC_00687 TaxID=2975807 RepID=UPI0022526A5F|nr:hypothetical protein [Streptomyces sp. NBC_00687]MCX4912054.1 hypothetical protein [Streptomyces sp. NBC_00687]